MKKNLLNAILVAAALFTGTTAKASVIDAQLIHTGSSYVGSQTNGDTFVSTVDAALEHVNNTNFSGNWAGAAYAYFGFDLPEGESVVGATFTFTGYGESRNARDTQVQYVNAGVMVNFTSTPSSEEDNDALGSGTAKVSAPATWIKTVSFPKATSAVFDIDVTEALKAIVDAGQSYIIFKLTGNPGGGDMGGMGAEDAEVWPRLVIETAGAGDVTTYTIRYVDYSDNDLKDPKVVTTTIGTTVSVADEDVADFTDAEGQLYRYDQGTESITTTADAEANVMKLYFNPAQKWSYTVKSEVGDYVYSGEDWNETSVTVPYPQFIVVDGMLYEKPATNKEYRYTFTLDSPNMEVTIEGYSVATREVPTGEVDEEGNAITETVEVDNVYFFTEAEKIAYVTTTSGNNTNIRCSMAEGGYNANEEPLLVCNLEPGSYDIEVQVWGNSGTDLSLQIGDEVFTTPTAGYILRNETNVTVETETPVYMLQGGANGKCFDWIKILKATGSTVGIENMTPDMNKQAKNSAIFNALGQRVMTAVKGGLYIVNGKKYMVK